MTLKCLRRAVRSLRFLPHSLALVLVGGVATTTALHAQGSGAQVRLERETISLRVGGGTEEVSVLASDIQHRFVDRNETSEGLGVFQLAVHFNPGVVTVTDMEPGEFLGSTGRGTSCFSQIRPDDSGTFEFACVSNSPPENGPQGDGLLATLTLTPVGGGTSDLELTGELGGPLSSNGDNILFNASGATVRVSGPTAVPGSYPTPNPQVRVQTAGGNAGGGANLFSAGNAAATGNTAGATSESSASGVGGISIAGSGVDLARRPVVLVTLAVMLGLAGVLFLLVGGVSRRRS
jgi:hypothetical protein